MKQIGKEIITKKYVFKLKKKKIQDNHFDNIPFPSPNQPHDCKFLINPVPQNPENVREITNRGKITATVAIMKINRKRIAGGSYNVWAFILYAAPVHRGDEIFRLHWNGTTKGTRNYI